MTLALLALAALLAMIGAWLLPQLTAAHPAAHVHLAFALGVMPLIMAAMTHFVPVLTRTRGAPPSVQALSLVGWAGGGLATAFFVLAPPTPYRTGAALLALTACSLLALWQWTRGRRALGTTHPGLNWYLAALACLAAALATVLGMDLWPGQYPALKRLHLHLNLFGFVALTAVGTLQVLLPTPACRPDPGAAARLRTDLIPAAGGALLIAAGAAWLPPLAWGGTALWLYGAARLGRTWLSLYRQEIFFRHGAAPLLAAALAGLCLALLGGLLHGVGRMDSKAAGHLFVFAFLFPLVSGAAGQLLPLWVRPGRQTPWHDSARKALTIGAGPRAFLFLGAGLLAAAGAAWGRWFALAGLLPLVLATLRMLLRPDRTERPDLSQSRRPGRSGGDRHGTGSEG